MLRSVENNGEVYDESADGGVVRVLLYIEDIEIVLLLVVCY